LRGGRARAISAVPAERLSRTGLALLGLVALAWGCNWPVMKRVLAEMPPWTYPGVGLMLASVALMTTAAAAGQTLRVASGEWPRLIAIAFTNFTLWQVFAAYGVTLLPAGRAAILNFTMPVWSILLGSLVLRERLSVRRACALALGVCGVALLLAGDFRAILAAPLGVALMLAAAMSWAVSVVLMKRYPVSLAPLAFTAWQMVIGGVPIFIGALILESHLWQPLSLTASVGYAYSIVATWVVGYWAWTRAAVSLPLATASLGTLAIPVVGVGASAIFLGERPGYTDLAALALLVAALATLLAPWRATH